MGSVCGRGVSRWLMYIVECAFINARVVRYLLVMKKKIKLIIAAVSQGTQSRFRGKSSTRLDPHIRINLPALCFKWSSLELFTFEQNAPAVLRCTWVGFGK